MAFNRLYVSHETDIQLRTLKTRTGLTPNLLCRLGLCLSLAEPSVPDTTLYEPRHDEDRSSMREFNRYTLTGQWDAFFFALVRERLVQDGLDPEAHLEEQFKAHLCRGVGLLQSRLKSVADLADLVAAAHRGTNVDAVRSDA